MAHFWTVVTYLSLTFISWAALEQIVMVQKPDCSSCRWTWTRYDVKCSLCPIEGWDHPTVPGDALSKYTVCNILIPDGSSHYKSPFEPNNWLLSDLIQVREVNKVDVTVEYSTTKCPPSALYCKEYFDAYVWESDSVVLRDKIPHPININGSYRRFASFNRQSSGFTVVTVPLALSRRYFVLGFRDQGGCRILNSVKVTYNVCPQTTLSRTLISVPRTVAPSNDRESISVLGECSANSVLVSTSLNVLCESNDEWNITRLGGGCVCKEDMENIGGKCEEILLEQPRRGVLWSWHTSRKSLSGAGWNFASSEAYSVCDITIATEPTNWLRTDFIDVKDAKMLNIKLKYNLRRCPPPPTASSFCKHKWSIYVLHVEKEVVGVNLNPLTANEVTYQEVETIAPTVLPAPGKMESYDYDVKIVTKKGGVYLALLDQGACVSLSSVIVSYNYCSEIDRGLVRFSRAAAPVNDSSLEEQRGRCTDVNSLSKVKLSGVCLSNGEWNITDAIKCFCKPGYELVNGTGGNVLECSACLKGFYKSVASNSKCDECPTNSASNTGRTGCLCHEGFYKKPGLRVAPCKALPKAPRNANVTVVKETYVEIMWERTPGESDGKLRYSVDCFRCKSSKYKDCKESCGPSVEYKPNKDNVTDGTVAVNGLPPDSFLKFRVYSVNELNAQEKDRDIWNYVTVSAKTKAMHPPRPSTTITPTWPSTPRPSPWTMHPPRPSTTPMHTPRPSTTTMHPPRPSTTTMHTPRPSTTRPKFAFTISCFPSSMVAHIARDSLPSGADVSLLHLNDPSCGVSYVTKKSVIITAPLKGCGTVRRNIGYKMYFHNKVVVPSGYGEKRSLSVFPFKSVYSRFGFP